LSAISLCGVHARLHVLKIDDLHFHDLRHEGTYRIFPRAAIPAPAQKVSYPLKLDDLLMRTTRPRQAWHKRSESGALIRPPSRG
jgi:hypothetical protein